MVQPHLSLYYVYISRLAFFLNMSYSPVIAEQGTICLEPGLCCNGGVIMHYVCISRFGVFLEHEF